MSYYLYLLSYVLATSLFLDNHSRGIVVVLAQQQPTPTSPSIINKQVNRVIFDWIDDNGIQRNANISDMIEPYGLLRNLNNRTRISNPFIRFPYKYTWEESDNSNNSICIINK